MEFFHRTQLNDAEKKEINNLYQDIHNHDHTFLDPYLSNQFNFFKDMPTFFIAKSQHKFVGFIMLYADGDPKSESWVDIDLAVHPNKRRQGIATRLWQDAKKTLIQYGYHNFNFSIEENFLANNPNFLTNTHLVINEADNEYKMIMENYDDQFIPNPNLNVRLLQDSDIKNVISMYCEAFTDSTAVEANTYLSEGIKDPDTDNYLLESHGKPIGLCAVDTGSSNYYLFGLLVAKSYRNQGLGTQFIKHLLHILNTNKRLPTMLSVEESNQAAHHLYQKIGFKDQTKIYYLVTPDKHNVQ